ncbi:hypothetical protein OEZ85_002356 [Tetradesmus obliquus]|nr:hypothetical protein OEZ85_002356 [Tetradesmus obliquus]
MFMNLTDASSAQSAERQFMQVPDQDVGAFLRFLAQPKTSIDPEAMSLLRATGSTHEQRTMTGLHQPPRPMSVAKPLMPIDLETQLRTASMTSTGVESRKATKWSIETAGTSSYKHGSAALQTEDVSVDLRASAMQARNNRTGRTGGELMIRSSLATSLRPEQRLPTAPSSRQRLEATQLLNPASASLQGAIFAEEAPQLTRAIVRLPIGHQGRCLLVLHLRMAGRLGDRLLYRLHKVQVYDNRDGKHPAPCDTAVQDFIYVDASGSCTLTFRDGDGNGKLLQQHRAALASDVAAELLASLDMCPRSHLALQRGSMPYTLGESFHKRMRCTLRDALQDAGQVQISFKDMLAVAHSNAEHVQQVLANGFGSR